MAIRPFDPDRERQPLPALFVNLEPDTAPVIESVRELAAVKRSPGLSGEELDRFFNEVFERPDLTLDDIYPFVVRVAWRVVRCMAKLRGAIGPDESLERAGERLPGAWDEPWALLERADTRDRLVREMAAVRVPLLPPAPPAEWLNGEKDVTYYDPASDAPLCNYVQTFVQVAKRLGVPNRKEGRLGLRPLADLSIARAAMPSSAEILACERVMVEEAVGAVLEHGHFGAVKALRDRYGLHDSEVGDLLLMARLAMQNIQGGMDTQAKRALMEARLEELAARARSGLDLRAELMALKELGSVQGLKIVDPEGDDIDDMIDVVDQEIAASEGRDDDTDIPELPAGGE